MKICRKLVLWILIIMGIFLINISFTDDVQAYDVTDETAEKNNGLPYVDNGQLFIKAYVVQDINHPNKDYPLGYIALSSNNGGTGNYGLTTLTNQAFGIKAGETYQHWYIIANDNIFVNSDDQVYSSEGGPDGPLNEVYYELTQFNAQLDFVDQAGNIVNSGQNKQNASIDGHKINLTSITAPKGYILDLSQSPILYNLGYKREFKVRLIEKPNLELTVVKSINGKHGSAVDTKTFNVPKNLTSWDNYLSTKLSQNSSYEPQFAENTPIAFSATDAYNKLDDVSEPISYQVLKKTFSSVNTTDFSGYKINMIYTYKDYDDDKNPIEYNVPVQTSQGTKYSLVKNGKLGQKDLKIPAPEIKGYQPDTAGVLGTVHADGTISVNDGKMIKYSPIGTEPDNNHHNAVHQNMGHHNTVNYNVNRRSHSDDVTVTKIAVNLATLNKATVYDVSGTASKQTMPVDESFKADQKLVRDGTVYYRIEPNKYLRAKDVYLYDDVKGDVRTYSDSYKRLINAKDDQVRNRALAAGSDWYFDRRAELDDQEYYRVATNEWVANTDVFSYRPDMISINLNKGTLLYNEKGKTIGAIGIDSSFKSDRVATVSGKAMSRIATNEYVLVSDVK